MSGRNGVHGSGLVHAPIVGACPARVVISAVFALVQVPTGCSSTCGVIKVLADWGTGFIVGSWSGDWSLNKRLCS